ncbi:MAG: FAD-dependent oxidoreductase [Dongiaceae bacterium]
MARDPRYDILFEPVRIGPVTARNRFYQVPHCNGMGTANPRAMAAMRGVKAEGGWSVVCTEECEIHPSGDVSPYHEARLWDDDDIPALALMAEEVHRHGSLAGIELTHNGPTASNVYSREVPIGPTHQPLSGYWPTQARAMDRQDIRDYRRWHRDAALRSMRAGFDIVYCYAAHDLSLAMHFLQRRRNDRIDEYGGSLENRVRLFREIIEDAKEAVGHRCGVVVRFATDEMMGDDGIVAEAEGRDVVEMLAELPDLWDVNVSPWVNDSITSRFSKEGHQLPFTAFVKSVTTKPVVGVGRFTSPDTMVSLIKSKTLDMIGAARPSIADPFLPVKIEEGRLDDIRECIGCNICVSGDFSIAHMRCTQNPTMGEEWRKGWHPERIHPKQSEDSVLVVGGGPAGMEAARALGERGYRVVLAETGDALGGRVTREAKLPGLAEWGRVRDWRILQLDKKINVETYLGSTMTAADVCDFGAQHVAIATGAHWVPTGVGRINRAPIAGFDKGRVYTPDDIMAGTIPDGPVIVFDDDHYYMGGVVAERIKAAGREVALVTPAEIASQWTHYTLEYDRIQRHLLELGIELICKHNLRALENDEAVLRCVYTGRETRRPCASVVSVTMRLPEDALYRELIADAAALERAGIKTVKAIGDCWAPGTIAASVYAGHRYARELDAPPLGDTVAFKRELVLGL